MLTEEEIKKITQLTISELGEKATPEAVSKIVESVSAKINKMAFFNKPGVQSGRVILTSFGMNHPGIVSAITSALSKMGIDILDISQKILAEYYTMIMIIDITNSASELKDLQLKMNEIAEELKIKIYTQHEDVFRYMHRI